MSDKRKKTGGRQKGVGNRADKAARLAIGHFVDANTPRLMDLLDKIEKEEGALATFDCIMKVIEYHIPKLARVDSTVEHEGNITFNISTGISQAPNTIKYVKDAYGDTLIDEDGNKIIDEVRSS